MRIDTYNKFVIGIKDIDAIGELQLPVKWMYNVYEWSKQY